MADLIGKQLGNYQLVRLLGQGGFADVYLGEHIHLKTQAAIKVLSMRLNSHSLDGFLKEARTIAHLEHPHIVRVLEFGVEPEGNMPFLVMNYAPNGTLRQRYPAGTQVPLPDILLYVKQLAGALHYAHDQKLIHRDVKPENMLLGRQGEVQLSDFGIALVTQSSRYQNTRDVVGTVAYMAPEQLQGKPCAASDQYALGIAVYEWLCGERPFKGTFLELYSQHTVIQPPPLHARFPGIPPDVEHVVFTALAKQPQERFRSIQEFANALEQSCKAHEIIASDAPTFVKSQTSLSDAQPFPSVMLSQALASGPVSVTPSAPPSTGGVSQLPTYGMRDANATLPMETPITQPRNAESVISELAASGSSVQPRPELSTDPIQPAPSHLSRTNKVLSVIAVLAILLALSSYLFKFPPSPLDNPTPTPVSQANNAGTGATNTNTTTTTQTSSYKPGQLIYSATDWSKWKGSPQWKVINSTTYGSDGTGDSSPTYNAWPPALNLPANYAIEAQITFVRCTTTLLCEIELIGRGDGSTGGYLAGIYTNNASQSDPHIAFVSLIDKADLGRTNYLLDHRPHTFRVEFRENTMAFFVDGQKLCSATDNQYLPAGQVGIRAKKSEVNVTSFKVYAL